MKTNLLITAYLLIVSAGAPLAQSVSGIVKDKKTGEALSFAIVRIVDSDEGSICNIDGEFQIESGEGEVMLEARHVGYLSLSIKAGGGDHLVFEMEEDPVQLEEITIVSKSQSAFEIIQEALEKIPENYHPSALRSKAFYREIVQLDVNDAQIEDSVFQFSPVSAKRVSEALLTSYVPGHSEKKLKKMPRYRLINGRYRETDQQLSSELDSVLTNSLKSIELKGGVKNLEEGNIKSLMKSDFLTEEDDYEYELTSRFEFNGRPVYEIVVTPKPSKRMLLKGKVYVDEETLAIAYLESEFSPQHLENAFRIKILGIEVIEKQDARSLICEYSEEGWVLKYVSITNAMAININRKIKKRKTSIAMEMAIEGALLHSSYSAENVAPIEKEHLFRKKDQVTQKFTKQYDPKLWENETIIPLNRDILRVLKE